MHEAYFEKKFDNLNFLVIGDVFLDRYQIGTCSRISPEAPVPVLKIEREREVPGGAGNTALNIASLGGKVTLVSQIGNDQEGARLASILKKKKVVFEPIVSGNPTMVKTRVVSMNQQLIRIDREGLPEPSRTHSPKALPRLPRNYSAVLISDYGKGFIGNDLMKYILNAFKKHSIPVFVDPKPIHSKYYPGCSFLTPNWTEALQMADEGPLPCEPPYFRPVAKRLRQRFKANILLTLGGRGMYFYGGKPLEEFYLPTLAKEVFDVSGAGDTVAATFAYSLAQGYTFRESAEWANRAAGIVVGKSGTAAITLEELNGSQAGILTREDLVSVSKKIKDAGKTIVTLNGTFDVLHPGHLKIIGEAKKLGDVLIIGLNSDKSVKKLKGESRPILDQGSRGRQLLALRDVDYVHVFEETVPMPFLRKVRPHVHVNGSEYGIRCIEAPTLKKMGAKLHIVKKNPDFSSSEIISKLTKTSHS